MGFLDRFGKEQKVVELEEEIIDSMGEIEISFNGEVQFSIFSETRIGFKYGHRLRAYLTGYAQFTLSGKKFNIFIDESEIIFQDDSKLRNAHEYALSLDLTYINKVLVKRLILKGVRNHMKRLNDTELEERFEQMANQKITITVTATKSELTVKN